MVAVEFTDLALMASTESSSDVGGRGGVIEVKGEEVAGFLGSRM
jgi:hypothetical protein